MGLTSALIQIGLDSSTAKHLGFVPVTVAATGTTQSTAAELLGDVHIILSTSVGNTGVRLPVLISHELGVIYVRNHGAITATVYPASGEYINALALNVGINIAAGGALIFIKFPFDPTTSIWVTN